MKMLLINPPEDNEIKATKSAHARNNLVTLGLLYLASHLKASHEVKVVDMALLKQSTNELPGIIDDFKPNVIGLTSVITLWGTVLELIHIAKRHAPEVTTVVGGPNVSKYPAETLSHRDVDYIIVGCGQKPMLDLCNRLERHEKDFEIENCYAQEREYESFTTVHSKEHHIDNFPFPDRLATPYERYDASISPENPTTSMITSMGCPYRCAYCSSRVEQAFQLRKETKVVEEMAEVEQLGIKSVLFQDDLFTIKSKRVKNICEDIIHRGIKLHWSVKSRIDSIRPGMLDLMQQAGCSNIHFGIESGNDSTLLRMKKGYDVKKIKEAIKMVKESGLPCTGNFMLAYPGEEEKDVLNTIEFAASLDLNMTHFGITYAMPMTELFYEGVEAGRHSANDPWSEFTRNPDKGEDLFKIYASNTFSTDQLNRFLDIAFSKNRTLFDLNKERQA
ncbi:MAG: hypothetical protein A2Z25_00405 [Planctomycetes bacterium RBG_16_55_9]|nr:MAG: hypothetical protein A2Z25_00405 [Planctomycetes bacterium RBG_16_55_9]